MKVIYDTIAPGYIFPLSKKDIDSIKKNIQPEIIEQISYIRFICNTKTTREGRLVKDAGKFNIRINFCLNNNRSLVLSDDKQYLQEIKQFGGAVNLKTRYITWDIDSAKRYAKFVLLHEIGHIMFAEQLMNGQMSLRSTAAEEQWCNNFALENI